MIPWLQVVGMGDDGPEGLAPAARALVEGAEILAGGARLLDHVPAREGQRRLPYTDLQDFLERLDALRGTPVCLVATGDPMMCGIGSVLADRYGIRDLRVLPHPGAYSLAAARLGWALQECVLVTVHGRPLEMALRDLAPGVRMLILSRDGRTPMALARTLARAGYGDSPMTVLEHMGGAKENRIQALAGDWEEDQVADLNVIALEALADPGTPLRSRVPGLTDSAFDHDGMITKREVRASTLSALQPYPGARLWDVGAGCGTIGIEWMRAADRAIAVAFERDRSRFARIARNAVTLGVPGLDIVPGPAQESILERTDPPDAIFLGGGLSVPGLLELCWERLRPGGRLVINAVTLQAETRVAEWWTLHGGDMSRLNVSRLETIGPGLQAWKALAPVTQYTGVKP
ncbi:MAG: precorrin-6y C5,15-methyltransferase (decarboxylating) subunit CbiE [Rhodospirillum sp.]|nr:precorrin-6y C5,15-methyltransferase (decarboxylating) subunit CbiE [Rhodospirillum sp.]MCF8487911.1 precorrin-6y C5,15-methyltransferase (decarboxylating) subunit CbiE [Rhodospirillum sp.]MCF8501839.1 precorrin-6y C5,15-methyltransferase (decarboxylating) subunit CbiE [Rhodospirillum sp.]